MLGASSLEAVRFSLTVLLMHPLLLLLPIGGTRMLARRLLSFTPKPLERRHQLEPKRVVVV